MYTQSSSSIRSTNDWKAKRTLISMNSTSIFLFRTYLSYGKIPKLDINLTEEWKG